MVKRVPLDRQVKEICKLLTLWPSCPSESITGFVRDTLGVTPTRVCIQEAKKLLGLHEPEHVETTIQKRHYARFIFCNLKLTQGESLSEQQLVGMVEHHIYMKFSQRTNHRLVVGWVKEFQQEHAESKVTKTIRDEALEELKRMGIWGEEKSRQVDLI